MSFGSIGFQELLILLFIILIIFGGSRLPQLGKGLGEALRNFKSSFKEDTEKQEKDIKEKNNQNQSSS